MATENLTIRVDEKGAIVASRNIDNVGKSAKGAGGGLKLLKNALGALAAAAAVKQLIDLADTFTVIQNKLKIVTTGTENLAAITDELFEIATRTRSSFEATADSYSKFALAAKESGRSQEEMLNFTELVNKAVIIGGSSASEAAGGLRQLGQGIASGALRGDELISVLENLPFVADTIAKGLGVTRGALRDMGKEGKITADVVLDAFKDQADFLNTEYSKTVITVGQSMTLLQNALLKLVGGFDEGSGASSALAQGIAAIAEGMVQLETPINIIKDVMTAIFQVIGDRMRPVIDQMVEWGVTWDSIKNALINVGLFLTGFLRTALMVLDDLIFGTSNVANVMQVLWDGTWNEIGRSLEVAVLFWTKLFEDFINKAITELNKLPTINIAPADFTSGDAPREAFEWAKKLAEAVEGGAGPLTSFFDDIFAKYGQLTNASNAAAIEAVKKGAGEGIDREGGEAAKGKNELARDALIAKTVLGLERENQLMAMTTSEATKQVALWKILDDLKKLGGTGEDDISEITSLLEANTAIGRQKDLLDEILGPQLAYNQAIADLAALQAKGLLTTQEVITKTAELKESLEKVSSDDVGTNLSNALVTPFEAAGQAVTDFVQTGEFKIRNFITSILQEMAKVNFAKGFAGLGSSLGLPGFATGGDFTVGGNGGTDSQVVAFKATPGEQVSVSTPGQQRQMQGGSVPSVAAPVVNVTIVNVTDPEEALEMMKSDEGGKVIVNQLSNNRTAAKQALA